MKHLPMMRYVGLFVLVFNFLLYVAFLTWAGKFSVLAIVLMVLIKFALILLMLPWLWQLTKPMALIMCSFVVLMYAGWDTVNAFRGGLASVFFGLSATSYFVYSMLLMWYTKQLPSLAKSS